MNILTEITIGNVITISGLVVAGAIAWGRLRMEIESMKERSNERQKQIDELAKARETDRECIAEIHAELTGLAATLSGLRDNLRDRGGTHRRND